MSSVPKGWRKIEKIRESGKTKGKKDVYLFSPEGTKIRSNVELQTYLKDRKSKLTLDFQSLSTKIKLSSAVKKTKDTVKPARNLPKKSVKRNSLKLKVSAKDKKSPKSLQKTSTSNKNKSVVKSTLKRKTIRSEKENTKKSNDSDEESLIDVENVQEENLVKEDIKSGMLDKKPRKVTTTKKKNNEKNPATDYPKVAKKFPSQVVKKCVITRKPSGKDSKGMPDMPKSSKDINNTIAAERSRKSTRRQEAKSGVKVEPQRQKKNLNVRKRPITKK